jgi:hypothetical protein
MSEGRSAELSEYLNADQQTFLASEGCGGELSEMSDGWSVGRVLGMSDVRGLSAELSEMSDGWSVGRVLGMSDVRDQSAELFEV